MAHLDLNLSFRAWTFKLRPIAAQIYRRLYRIVTWSMSCQNLQIQPMRVCIVNLCCNRLDPKWISSKTHKIQTKCAMLPLRCTSLSVFLPERLYSWFLVWCHTVWHVRTVSECKQFVSECWQTDRRTAGINLDHCDTIAGGISGLDISLKLGMGQVLNTNASVKCP